MLEQPSRSSNYKQLSYFRDLYRSPAHSYFRKAAQPKTRKIYPDISIYLRMWTFIVDYLRFRFGPRHAFQTYTPGQADNGVYQMPSQADIRIALAGDWATGTDEAAQIAALITGFEPHYSIHLGDVYYVGDPAEVDENFLGIANPANEFTPCQWPTGTEGTFALNGNHEMYSLGTAYFDKMLPALGRMVEGRPQGQPASFFCLENEFWRIIALDTGYNSIGLPLIEYFWQPDCALREEALDWLRNTVKPRSDDPRGIVLLSHHQYCSRFDDRYPKPAQQLTEFFSRPVLWFWGHEHRLVIYPQYALPGGISAFGRCIGHGGMPVELPPAKPTHSDCPVEFVDSRRYVDDEGQVLSFNGFAKLSLQRERLHVDYVDVVGRSIFAETWSVQNGVLTRIDGGQLAVAS